MRVITLALLCGALIACTGCEGNDDGGGDFPQTYQELLDLHREYAAEFCKCASNPDSAFCQEEAEETQCYPSAQECETALNDELPTSEQVECMDGVLEKYETTAKAMMDCQAQAYQDALVCINEAIGECSSNALYACGDALEDADCPEPPEGMNQEMDACMGQGGEG